MSASATLTLSNGLTAGATTALTFVTLTATFGFAVSGVDAADIVTVGATEGAFTSVSATLYTLVMTLTGSSVTFDVASAASLPATLAATQFTLVYAPTAVTFTMSDSLSSGMTTSLTALTVTATFGVSVSGVLASDFALVGATAGTLGGSGTVWTLVLTLTAPTVTVDMSVESGAISPSNAAASQFALTKGPA